MRRVLPLALYWTSAVIAAGGILVGIRGFTSFAVAQQRSLEQTAGSAVAAIGLVGLLLTKVWLDRATETRRGPRRRVPLVAAALALVWSVVYVPVWLWTAFREVRRDGATARETGWSVPRAAILAAAGFALFVGGFIDRADALWLDVGAGVAYALLVFDGQRALDRFWRARRPDLRPDVTAAEWVALGSGVLISLVSLALFLRLVR